jgi:rhamnosyltransferase subunit B
LPRVLLGQDYGEGFGHAARLVPIAQALERRGVETYLAVPDFVTTLPVLKASGLPFVQAPHKSAPQRREFEGRVSASFADILARGGFDQPQWLLAHLLAWQGLLDLYRPDLIIADYAPVLSLAAFGKVPVVRVGTGYTVPPADEEKFPKLYNGALLIGEEAVLACVREAQRERGREVPRALPEIVRGAAAFITHLDRFDPYAAHRRKKLATGPLKPLPAPASGPPEVDYFAYVTASYDGVRTVLDALRASGLTGSLYARGARPESIAELRRRGFTVHETPPPLAEVAALAALVVHHGGIGTTESVLALGRPQLVIPRHAEQTLNGWVVGRQGAALTLPMPRELTRDGIEDALQRLRGDASFTEAARQAAHEVAAAGPSDGLAPIVGACMRLLGRG